MFTSNIFQCRKTFNASHFPITITLVRLEMRQILWISHTHENWKIFTSAFSKKNFKSIWKAASYSNIIQHMLVMELHSAFCIFHFPPLIPHFSTHNEQRNKKKMKKILPQNDLLLSQIYVEVFYTQTMPESWINHNEKSIK